MTIDVIRLSHFVGAHTTDEQLQTLAQEMVDFLGHPDVHHGQEGDKQYADEEDGPSAQRLSETVLFSFVLGVVNPSSEQSSLGTWVQEKKNADRLAWFVRWVRTSVSQKANKAEEVLPVTASLLNDIIGKYFLDTNLTTLTNFYGYAGVCSMEIKLHAERMQPCHGSNGRSWKRLNFRLTQSYGVEVKNQPERELTQAEIADELADPPYEGPEMRYLHDDIFSCEGVLLQLPFAEALQ
jgi:hypothetical protein